jgi:hypothetical protein
MREGDAGVSRPSRPPPVAFCSSSSPPRHTASGAAPSANSTPLPPTPCESIALGGDERRVLTAVDNTEEGSAEQQQRAPQEQPVRQSDRAAPASRAHHCSQDKRHPTATTLLGKQPLVRSSSDAVWRARVAHTSEVAVTVPQESFSALLRLHANVLDAASLWPCCCARSAAYCAVVVDLTQRWQMASQCRDGLGAKAREADPSQSPANHRDCALATPPLYDDKHHT